MKVKKAVGWLHLWLGLLSGTVVVILGITGCLYAFEKELKAIIHHGRLHVAAPEAGTTTHISELLGAAQKALGPDKPITRIEIPHATGHTYIFRAMKTNPDAVFYWNYYTYYEKVYINPYNGTVVATENTKTDFFQLVFSLHTQLWMGDKVGHATTGAAVLIFVVLLITGMILWWPKKWKATKRRQYFTIKWPAKFKRVNYDAHRILGLYAFVVLLIIAITGLVWSYTWVDEGVQFIANGGVPPRKDILPTSDTTQVLQPYAYERMLGNAFASMPRAKSYLMVLPAAKTGTVTVFAYETGNNHYERIKSSYDRYTGALLQSGSFDDLDRAAQVKLMNYDLHTGTVLNLPGKLMAFCASLIAASLPITGLFIWLRLGKSPKQAQ
jgi:uncharacterized iron-regulated membrane protein